MTLLKGQFGMKIGEFALKPALGGPLLRHLISRRCQLRIRCLNGLVNQGRRLRIRQLSDQVAQVFHLRGLALQRLIREHIQRLLNTALEYAQLSDSLNLLFTIIS